MLPREVVGLYSMIAKPFYSGFSVFIFFLFSSFPIFPFPFFLLFLPFFLFLLFLNIFYVLSQPLPVQSLFSPQSSVRFYLPGELQKTYKPTCKGLEVISMKRSHKLNQNEKFGLSFHVLLQLAMKQPKLTSSARHIKWVSVSFLTSCKCPQFSTVKNIVGVNNCNMIQCSSTIDRIFPFVAKRTISHPATLSSPIRCNPMRFPPALLAQNSSGTQPYGGCGEDSHPQETGPSDSWLPLGSCPGCSFFD